MYNLCDREHLEDKLSKLDQLFTENVAKTYQCLVKMIRNDLNNPMVPSADPSTKFV